MLSGLRVLDLTDPKGWLCGRILADLGMEVIKVEPPGGEPSRLLPPYYHNEVHPEKSLYHMPHNAGKKGVTLNLESERGRELFLGLAKVSDFVIESFSPGYLEGLGLGYPTLSRENQGLILVSITPFGQTGPRRDYQASDLTLMALSGLMNTIGDPERPPLRFPLDQSHNVAGANGAQGALLALHHRQRSGRGQQVDVSMLDCLIKICSRDMVRWEFEGQFAHRAGNRYTRGKISTRMVWRCRDGHVTWGLMGGQSGARENYPLTKWMVEEEAMGAEELQGVKWEEVDLLDIDPRTVAHWEDLVGSFFLTHTRQELLEGGRKRRLTLVPINDLEEVRRDEQLAARGFWKPVEHPELGETMAYPGHFFIPSRGECHIRGRAPLIGEHNAQVYGELLHLTPTQVEGLGEQGII